MGAGVANQPSLPGFLGSSKGLKRVLAGGCILSALIATVSTEALPPSEGSQILVNVGSLISPVLLSDLNKSPVDRGWMTEWRTGFCSFLSGIVDHIQVL